MARYGKLEGLQEVMTNLHNEIERIEQYSMKGLIRAVIRIRRSMDKQSPLIPVDTGNLRASWFTAMGYNWHVAQIERDDIKVPNFKGENAAELASEHSRIVSKYQAEAGTKAQIYFGFSANYATWVHELIDGKFNRPGSGAKFLEAALLSQQPFILEEIRKSAQIKK